jgi:hypothetical protein
VTREKYSEIKLEAQFLKVSKGYLVATPGALSTTQYSNNPAIVVTPLLGNGTGSFFVVRHADYTNQGQAEYNLNLPTSIGVLTIPQLGGNLSLTRRDSKIHVVDYPVANSTLLYSTAELLTWKKFANETILIVYGGAGELHEMAIKGGSAPLMLEGNAVDHTTKNGSLVLQWKAASTRQIVQVGELVLYLLGMPSHPNADLDTSYMGLFTR